MIVYAKNEDDSLFLKMSVLLFVELGSVLVIVLFAVVVLPQGSYTFRSFHLIIVHKLTVV